MATPEQIQLFEQTLDQLYQAFEAGLKQQLNDLWVNLANAGTAATRIQIVQLFLPVKTWIAQQQTQINQILAAHAQLNASTIDPRNPMPTDTAQLIQEAVITAQQAVDDQQNELIKTVVLSAAVGASIAVLLRQLRPWIASTTRRITSVWVTVTQQVTAAVFRLRALAAGITQFEYAGGTVANTRPFCRTHSGKTYSIKDIDKIWKQTWQGKAPGSPFVVRGGYNCRHYWIAVK